MPAPSLTYTLTNGQTADASQVMQNFNDVVNGVTDGTKDLSISALTCAGTATLNGAVNLGNASADDITVTGSLASTLPIKTTASYDIGSTTLGLRNLYLGANSQTVALKGSGSMSATWTLTLPVTAGTKGYGLQTDGSGVSSWQPMHTDIHSVSSADYTVTDTDGYRTVLMTTSNTARTVTLPTAADNTDRVITIKKVDSGTGTVSVDGESTETIDGSTSAYVLYKQYDSVTLQCDGTGWHIIGEDPKVLPSFRAYVSSSQTLADNIGLDNTIVFASEDWDTHSWYDTSNGRFTPLVRGRYLITAQIAQTGNLVAGDTIRASIRKNGTVLARRNATADGNGGWVNISMIVECNGTTDYIDIAASQGSGLGSIALDQNTAHNFFQAHLLTRY